MLCKVTHCAGRVSANTRPHQLCWGDREMGTACYNIMRRMQSGGMHTCDDLLMAIYIYTPNLGACVVKRVLKAAERPQ